MKCSYEVYDSSKTKNLIGWLMGPLADARVIKIPVRTRSSFGAIAFERVWIRDDFNCERIVFLPVDAFSRKNLGGIPPSLFVPNPNAEPQR